MILEPTSGLKRLDKETGVGGLFFKVKMEADSSAKQSRFFIKGAFFTMGSDRHSKSHTILSSVCGSSLCM